MKESDLYEPVKKFLLENGCSNVYGEVLGFDVLGIHGPINIIVEMKTSLNFKVIEQALRALNYAHYVYIAVPKRKSNLPHFLSMLLKEKKIGLLEVHTFDGKLVADPTLPARYSRLVREWENRYSPNPIRKSIRPYHETQVGGVKGGESVTDYSVMIKGIKDYLYWDARRKWVTVEQILDKVETYYSQPKPQVMATLQAKWNSDWCETKIEDGKRYFRYKGEMPEMEII